VKGGWFITRRKFDRNFKLAAVKLVVHNEMPVSEVSKQLNIYYNSLYRCIREYEEHGESAFPWSKVRTL
jgi:transposase